MPVFNMSSGKHTERHLHPALPINSSNAQVPTSHPDSQAAWAVSVLIPGAEHVPLIKLDSGYAEAGTKSCIALVHDAGVGCRSTSCELRSVDLHCTLEQLFPLQTQVLYKVYIEV